MRADKQVEEELRAEIDRKEAVKPLAPFVYSGLGPRMNSRFDVDFERIFLSPHLASDDDARRRNALT